MRGVCARRPVPWLALALVLGGTIPATGPMGCATRSPGGVPAVAAAVVWVAGAVLPDPVVFTGLDPRTIAGAQISVYAVSHPEDARRLCTTLLARGDSIIVGLGRAMLPILLSLQGSPTRVWLGFDDPDVSAPGLAAWWAPAESLRLEVARAAVRHGPSQVTVIGTSIPANMLRVLRDSAIPVLPVAIGPGPAVGAVSSPDGTVLVVDPVPLAAEARRVFWACESPFFVPSGAAVEITMDWGGAVAAALGWCLGREGVPPGPTLGPWIALRSEEDAS